MLEIFYVTTLLAAIYLILGFCGFYERWFANGPAGITVEKKYWLIRLCIIFLVEITIFWIGMISVYLTSQQLGIRWRVLGLIYTPYPVFMPDATREARRPMGSRFPGLTLAFNGLRQWSRKCFRRKSVVILHKYFCFIICLKWVHPKRTLNITIYCVLIPETTTYCYNSGFSISGSSSAALCLSAICCAV